MITIQELMNKAKKCYSKLFKKCLTPIKPKKETKTRVTSTSGPMTNGNNKKKSTTKKPR
jgi:hypothetical protein